MANSLNKLVKDLEVLSLDEIISNWNLNRIFMVTIAYIMFQLANLTSPVVYNSKINCYTVIGCMIISILFLGFLIYIFFKKRNCSLLKSRLFKIFWLVFPFTMMPFYISDIHNSDFPLNLLISLALIAVYPIISLKYTVAIFVINISLNLVLFLIYRPELSYFVYSIVIILSTFFISTTIHGKYIDLLTELNKSSTYDGLSKVLNKNAGYQRASNMYEMCKRMNHSICVYMLDIDYFKTYNDTFGHPAGDEVIRQVADCIKSTFARNQDITCRYGGEEFLICCSNSNIQDYETMANTLLDKIFDLRIEAGTNLVAPYVTASIGLSYYSFDNNSNKADPSLDDVIKNADSALYKAKSLGRNQVFVMES